MIREGAGALQAVDWTQLADISTPLSAAVISVRYLTVFSSVIAFILFCYALRIVGVTEANAFNNIRPAFTALWMFLFFGEHLPAGKWLGILLVIFGLFVCQRPVKQNNK
jgi:drug/metabolite transporter (DMT)-like permease